MLPVHGSVEFFSDKILQIPRVLAVLISRLGTADSASPSIAAFTTTVLYSARGIQLYFKHFGDLSCGYRQVLPVFRPVVTASTGAACIASTRSSTKILSISAVYWEYEAYSEHLSVYCRFDNFIRILLQTSSIVDGWSHEWELKQTTFGEGNSSI